MFSPKKQSRTGLETSGSFLAQLWRWKGSLYRLCLVEFIAFIVPFAILSAVYRHVLNEDQKRVFEQLVRYCSNYLAVLPISFILGFYVNIVATRWWQQCLTLPWPDRMMLSISMYIPGTDKETRTLRETLCRYCNLMGVLLYRTISESVRSRFATLEDVVKAGFMTKAEMASFQSVQANINMFWLPGLWCAQRLQEAQLQGKISDPRGAQTIINELLEFRSKCGILWSYDWVSLPIVYNQVVTLTTYSYLAASILGRQYTDVDKDKIFPIDVYFPIWSILQILFYMGLLKVAENMIHPYGDDEEDFDLNFLINRHKEAIHLSCQVLTNEQCPPIIPDDEVNASGRSKEIHSSLVMNKSSIHGISNIVAPSSERLDSTCL